MKLHVKNIDTKGVQNDSGLTTVVNIIKLVGESTDGPYNSSCPYSVIESTTELIIQGDMG